MLPGRRNAPPPPDPLRLFVTGGGGTGKSFLIAALHELAIRAHQVSSIILSYTALQCPISK